MTKTLLWMTFTLNFTFFLFLSIIGQQFFFIFCFFLSFTPTKPILHQSWQFPFLNLNPLPTSPHQHPPSTFKFKFNFSGFYLSFVYFHVFVSATSAAGGVLLLLLLPRTDAGHFRSNNPIRQTTQQDPNRCHRSWPKRRNCPVSSFSALHWPVCVCWLWTPDWWRGSSSKSAGKVMVWFCFH